MLIRLLSTINANKLASVAIRVTSYSPAPHAKVATAYASVPWYAFIENTLRAWGLASLYSLPRLKIGRLFPTKRPRLFKDRGHITLFQNRGVAILASLLHLLPVAGTAIITWYVHTEYFFGADLGGGAGSDKFKLLGLQFAAKIHELLMVSTLSTVIFAMVRHELAHGVGVPLALLSSGLSVSKVSFLWSKDFVALCRARYDTWYKKVLFLAAILVSIILSVAVAPASATALTPIKKTWEAGGTKIWLNSTKEQLFPSVLNDSHTLGPTCNISDSNNECPSAYWQQFSTGYLPKLALRKSFPPNEFDLGIYYGIDLDDVSFEVTVLSRREDTLGFPVTSRHSEFQVNIDPGHAVKQSGLFWNGNSFVAAPHIAISDSLRLGYIFYDAAAKYDDFGSQLGKNPPAGHRPHRFSKRSSSSYKSLVPLAAASSECVGHFDFEDSFFSSTENTEVVDWLSSIANSSRPELLWFTPSQNMPGEMYKASIGAAVYFSKSSPQGPFSGRPVLMYCLFRAGWKDLTMTGTSVYDFPHPADDQWHMRASGGTGWDSNITRVMIEPSFAQYTNPHLPASNSTVFEEMVISAGLWNQDTGMSVSNDSLKENPRGLLTTVLNLMIVNGMARTAPYTTQHAIITNPVNRGQRWWPRIFMPKEQFGPGGDGYESELTPEQRANSFSFQMNVSAEGYGYSFSRSTASRVSIIILLIHLAIAVSYIIWTITTGASSSSWDSPAELIALALASEEPADRKGLATGESSIESLKKRYCVIADGDRLQLKEWHSRVPEENRVKPNTVYE